MLATVLSLVAALAFALPGQTATVEEAAEALRSDPVYVDPEATRTLSDAEQDQLRSAIRDAGTPIYVAVLPASAGDAEDLVQALFSASGLSGTYAVVTEEQFRANSTSVPDTGDIAGSAFQANRSQGTLAVLEAFVAGVSSAAADGGTVAPVSDGGSGGDEGSGSLLPLALLGGGGLALYAWSKSRRRGRARVEHQASQAEFDADVQMLRAELSVLADDVMRLEPQVVTAPDARADYEAATTRYRAASAALDYADEPVDLVRVERVVREAEYAMSRARAIVEGRKPPTPPVELQRPGRHEEPALDLDDAGRPVYIGAGPFYGGGWFGGGGGLFSGLLLGSMLGGMGPFGWGGGWHHDHGGWGDGGGGWDGGFGGGDWGGDIGGGDW